jgi:hypothetical protein
MQDMVEHVAILEQLASHGDRCTEFGVRIPDGTSSTMALLRGTRHSLISYDIQWCDCREPEDLARRSGKHFQFIRQSSLEAVIAPTDLLMIDSLHTYEQLRDELARHHDKVDRYIVMHDTTLFGLHGEDGKAPGLQAAIGEFLHAQPEWQFLLYRPECCGLTVLERQL